jgi:hypothetical protein
MKGVGKAPRSVVLLLIACMMMSAARDARADDGGELTVSLLTFGPGDHPFSKFGHNGLLVENSKLATRAVYNYGTFSFDSLWLIPKFMLGKYRYWLSVQTFEQTLATPGPWCRRASLSSSRREARATRTCGNNLPKSSSTRLRRSRPTPCCPC